MKRRLALGLGIALLLVATLYVVRAAATNYPLHRFESPADSGLWRGAYHMHTVLSDGRGTLDQLVQAAKSAGATWLVVSDHNKVYPGGPRYQDGVLVIPSCEVSTQAGHLMAIDMARELTEEERTGDPVAAVRALGAVPVASHPLNRKRPYLRLDEEKRLAGMEILSADDMLREGLLAPLTVISAALAYPVSAEHAAVQFVERPAATLAKWDALLRERPLAGMCAIDAHGIPAYSAIMRTMGFYAQVGHAPTGQARQDADELIRALASGRSFCGIDAFGSSAGFHFTAVEKDGSVHAMGEELPLSEGLRLEVELGEGRVPEGAVVTVYCGGTELPLRAEGGAWIAVPMASGACRAEVLAPVPGRLWGSVLRPWILSNPIYLRPGPPTQAGP